MISYQKTQDLVQSAKITYENMHSHYTHYAVDWDASNISKKIVDLDNWDILYDGKVVGAIRLEFDDEGCCLRDLQISKDFQNKGIGLSALSKVEKLAKECNKSQVRLKVFKISPAYKLYTRFGFKLDKEDDRFFYMSKTIV